jgi:hypothetical protein
VRRLSKRVHRTLTAALAEAADATLDDTDFVALMFLFNDGGGDTRCVGGWCAAEDGGSIARRVASALSGIRGQGPTRAAIVLAACGETIGCFNNLLVGDTQVVNEKFCAIQSARLCPAYRPKSDTDVRAPHSDDVVELGAKQLRRHLVFATVFQLPCRPQRASFGDLARWLRWPECDRPSCTPRHNRAHRGSHRFR